MITKQWYNRILIPVLVLLSFVLLSGKPRVYRAEKELLRAQLLVSEKDSISNVTALHDFFDKLYKVKNKHDNIVSIVHIGDSHIQADFFTEVIRQSLQSNFGNAGRGLIVPYRIAGTNEPLNYFTSSGSTWRSRRCVVPDSTLPIGIGGITINTKEPTASLEVDTKNFNGLDYSFNKVTVFYQNDESSYELLIKDSIGAGLLGNIPAKSYNNHAQVSWAFLPYNSNKLTLHLSQTNPNQNKATIYGLSLENGECGVLYHAIGVNGAEFKHYNHEALFAEQTAELHPDLFIISLGTNEAQDINLTPERLVKQIQSMVDGLRVNNPNAEIMLTTPPASFYRRVKINKVVLMVRNTIMDYAIKNNMACWDMFEALGGNETVSRIRTAGLMSKDGIHFTRDGYHLQGELLYNAINKAYLQHVANKY